MNKSIKKLIVLGISISFLILTAISFTFAWMSINTSVYLMNIELKVSQGDGILISVDDVNYSNNISIVQIEHAIVMKKLGLAYENGVMVDKDGKAIDMTDENFDDEFEKINFGTVTSLDGKTFKGYNESSTDVTDGKYIEFDLYFKADNDNTSIYFNHSSFNYDSNGVLLKNTGIDGTSVLTSTDDTKASYLLAPLYTMDSLGNQVLVHKGTEGLEINGKNAMRFSTEVDDVVKVYEPNIGLGSYATDLDSTNYSDMYIESSYYDSTKNASFTYLNNLKSEGNKLKALAYESIPETYKDFNTYESDHIVDILNKDDAKKVTFRYWLEGWDADCFDAIIGLRTTISLSFTTKAVTLYEKLKTVNYHNGDEIKAVNYYDYNEIKNLYLPINSGAKKFYGWYTNETYAEKFDFTKVKDSLETNFDCYAYWN